jgi:hypothetical protein
LEAKSVNRLFSAIFSSPEVLHERVSLTVHYRLGDLLTIKEKRPVEVSRIDSVLSKYFSPQGKFLVLTDSASEDFFEFVKSSPYFANCNPKRFAPVETLAACISSSIFIGSSAKISLWAAIFRQFQFSLPSYLPNELSWAGNNGLKAIWY